MAYGEAGILLQYFQQQLIDKTSFFHDYQMDLEEKIINYFGLMQECYLTIIVLEISFRSIQTCCTNGDHMPLVIFSRFNHYRGWVIFWVALLYDETIESFKWLFQTFLQAHNKKNLKIVFTYQDQAMEIALEEIILLAKHDLCTWHIMRNGVKHLGNLIKDDSHFLRDFEKCMYDYKVEIDFENPWRDLLVK